VEKELQKVGDMLCHATTTIEMCHHKCRRVDASLLKNKVDGVEVEAGMLKGKSGTKVEE
jgi:hypothetical protein